MSKEYRYWWLKLEKDFFNRKLIKKLRRLDNGAVYTIVYLKMQLESLQSGGILSFENTEDTFEEELAFTIDEDLNDTIETVRFLKKHGLLIELSTTQNQLTDVMNNIDSEGASAKRVRKYRSKSSQSNEEALQCNTQSLQNDGDGVTLLRRVREDKDKEKDKSKRESKSKRKSIENQTNIPPSSVSSPALLLGQFGNVELTQIQLDWLKNRYPDDYDKKIDRLSEYLYDTGKTYSNHFGTICKWAKEDEEKKKSKSSNKPAQGKRPDESDPKYQSYLDFLNGKCLGISEQEREQIKSFEDFKKWREEKIKRLKE